MQNQRDDSVFRIFIVSSLFLILYVLSPASVAFVLMNIVAAIVGLIYTSMDEADLCKINAMPLYRLSVSNGAISLVLNVRTAVAKSKNENQNHERQKKIKLYLQPFGFSMCGCEINCCAFP